MSVNSMSFRGNFLREYRYNKPILIFYWSVFISFPIAKMIVRPWFSSEYPDSFFTLILFSYPNFVEAVMGSMTLSVILLLFRFRFLEQLETINNAFLYSVSIFLSAVYVITQELKIHNLGGTNIYDLNDVYASITGLLLMLFLFLKYGIFVKKNNSSNL